jgi:hypothetical protein
MDGLQPTSIAGGCMGGSHLLVHTHGELYRVLLSSWLLPALEATAFLAVKLLAFGLLHIHSGNQAELTAP